MTFERKVDSPRVKQILHRVNSLICTPKNSNHVRSQKIRPGKQIDLFVYCICIIMWKFLNKKKDLFPRALNWVKH